MPSTTEDDAEGTNPFEELDTDVELPEPAVMPALPPLLPEETNQQDENQNATGEEVMALKQEEQPVVELKAKVTKSFKSTLKFTTDLTKSARDNHPCGILHFTRLGTGSGVNAAEEHAFAWIAHQNIESHLNATLSHMARFGFTGDATFVPYSSRRSWIEKYPLAFPHVYCGENGKVTGFPHWSGGGHQGGSGHNAVSAPAAAAADGASTSVASALGLVSTAKKPTKVGRKKKKIFPTAHLPNDERDELHIEMYKYLQWLNTSLANHAASNTNNTAPGLAEDLAAKQKLAGSAAGINVTALQNLMENMEQTFKVVRSSQSAIAAAASAGDGPSLPFLEEVLGEPLGKLAEANKKNPQVRNSRRQSRRVGLHFDDMYERLAQFHQAHGHVNVPQKYAQDSQLGSWVANMRSKRKAMTKRGMEYEPNKSYDNVADDEIEDDIDDNGEEEDPLTEGEGGGGLAGKKRKRGAKGRQRLTKDRVQRLDSIGFQWAVANPNTKSWEERFEDLKEYQQMHGTTRVPRSSGTLGEWVHMQRRLHNKKDKNFMVKKAPLLDDIGFEWHPRKHALVSWEDNFNRLVEFGRMNRHYNVQSPFPEGYAGDFDDQDGELVEAHRFSKWVKRIHAEYRSYASGKGSRMLNDARVMQLREIGFQFV